MDRGESEPDQVVIDDAEVVAVKIAPYDRDEGSGDDHRKEIGEAEQIEKERGHRAVKGEREQKSDGDVSRHCKDREAERIPEDLQRSIAGKEPLKILQAYPARASHRIVVGEAEHEGNDHRRQHENGVERERRQYEKKAGTRLRPREIGFGSPGRRLHRICVSVLSPK